MNDDVRFQAVTDPFAEEQAAKIESLAAALVSPRSPVSGAVVAFILVGYEGPGDEGVALTIVAAFRQAERAHLRAIVASRLRGMADDMERADGPEGLTTDVPS